MKKNILTIGGSSSKKSINKKLAEYAGSLMQQENIINIDLNDFEMPLFSVDVEAEKGYSKATTDLNELFNKADGFIISLAEHNGAYSAAFKNTLDWLSRIEGKVWRNKPMLLLSASPGIRGGKSVLDIALGKFPFMGAKIVGSMPFPLFNENFKEGEIVNSELKEALVKLVKELENSLNA